MPLKNKGFTLIEVLVAATILFAVIDLRAKANGNVTDLTGAGLIWQLPYQWQANLLEFKAPVDKFDPEAGTSDKYAPRYQLWQVNLLLGSGKSALDYHYTEFSWIN
jgi:Tfp pilus assembly protein PilV